MTPIQKRIAELENKNREVNQTVDEKISLERAKDQSFIAKLIIWTFVALISVMFIFVVVSALFQSPDKWQAASKFLLEAVSSVMLPVVTLVLGYYFGKEKAANR